jgi:Na+/melibiose symporter-like transporter
MRVIMFLIPGILSALCYLIYIKGYKLTPDFYKEVRETIDKNREAAK